MFRSKARFTIFMLAFTLTLIIPFGETHASDSSKIMQPLPLGVTPKVVMGPNGAIHLLWTVSSVSLGGLAPGVWYSRFESNGTNSIPPRLIRNSTSVQSADIAIDRFDHPHFTWAEESAVTNDGQSLQMKEHSTLYYAELNITNGNVQSIPLTGVGRLVLWPSIAVDNNLTAHFMWTQLDPDSEKTAGAYYAAMRANMRLDRVVMVSSYNQNLSAIPRPHLAWDGVLFLHVAWTETDRGGDERVASSVTYGKMNLQNSSFTHLRIAEFDEPLQDATVAPGQDGSAYVVWQFQNASSDHGSIFVSQISKSGRIAFSKQIKHPDLMDSVSPYLAISADSKDNLYVVWYQTPRAPLNERFQSTSGLTSVSYVKLDYDGLIEETKSELVQGRVFAVTVSGSGDMYAISQQGIVRLAKPDRGFAFELIVIGAVTITAFAGATATEEGRYRFASCVILAAKSKRKDGIEDVQEEAILKFIYRRPGCRLRDLRHLSRSRKPLALKLARLESAGYLASARKGWARRFYVHPEVESRATSEGHPPLTIASRILIEVARNPGIWESKLAATLGLSQQIVHYHMKKLRATNVMVSEQDGKRKLHRLARTGLSRREDCADIV